MSVSLYNQVEILIATPLLHAIQILTKEVISGPLRVLPLVRKSSKIFMGLENTGLTLVQWLKGT